VRCVLSCVLPLLGPVRNFFAAMNFVVRAIVAVARCPLHEMPANKSDSQTKSVAFVPSRPWDISLVGAASSVAFAAVWWLLMSKSTDTTTSSSARSSKPIDFVPLFDAPFDRLKHFSGAEGVPVYKAVAQVLPLEQTGELMKFIQKFAAEKGWAMYSSEGLTNGYGEAVPITNFTDGDCPMDLAISKDQQHCILRERMDAYIYYVTSGGRQAKQLNRLDLANKFDYFRETLLYGQDRPIDSPILDTMIQNSQFIQNAKAVYGLADSNAATVVPYILFANFLLPGQELAIHTDVPEFRGVSRKNTPCWLLVVMHHSQLFARWRIRIATGVSWWTDISEDTVVQEDPFAGADPFKPISKAFVVYPQGAEHPGKIWDVKFNNGIVLDTDSYFHGVDEVASGGGDSISSMLSEGMKLVFSPSSTPGSENAPWLLMDPREDPANPIELTRYTFEQIRLSISWKSYVFDSAEDQRVWEEKSDELDRAKALEMLRLDCKLNDPHFPEKFNMDLQAADPDILLEFAYYLIQKYIQYPRPDVH
jgi:hypothetical protein